MPIVNMQEWRDRYAATLAENAAKSNPEIEKGSFTDFLDNVVFAEDTKWVDCDSCDCDNDDDSDDFSFIGAGVPGGDDNDGDTILVFVQDAVYPLTIDQADDLSVTLGALVDQLTRRKKHAQEFGGA